MGSSRGREEAHTNAFARRYDDTGMSSLGRDLIAVTLERVGLEFANCMGSLLNRQTGATWMLRAEQIIGRANECALRLDVGYVSGHHAEIRWSVGHWQIKDLGSRNGTFVNNERLATGRAPGCGVIWRSQSRALGARIQRCSPALVAACRGR